MYILKKEAKDEILKKYKISYISKQSEISRQTIYNILRGGATRKQTAYFIAKTIDHTKKVEDYFKEI